MGLSNFFDNRIRVEKNIIKKSKDAFGAIGVLEALMGGVFVLGTLSGIFTLPTFLGMTIPAIFGVYTMKELKNNIKDSKANIEHIKSLEKNGADASRNHERNVKIKDLKEQKAKEIKKNDNYGKVMLGGVGGFLLGCVSPFSMPISTALMLGGYGTMVFGLHKSNKAANEGRKIQKEIDKLSDKVTVSNLKQKFVMSNEIQKNDTQEKNITIGEAKSHRKEKETVVDKYIEQLENQNYTEINNTKTR